MAYSLQSKYLLKASFIGTFAEKMLLPVWAILTNRVGGDILDAGIGYAIFSIVTGLFVMFIGNTKWYQRNVRSMVFWGFLVAGIGDVGYIFAHNIWELFFVQCWVGLSVGLLNPAWDALYSEDMEDGSAAGKWSFWNGGISFVEGIGAIVGSAVVAFAGWVPLFLGMGLVDGISIVYAYQVWKMKSNP